MFKVYRHKKQILFAFSDQPLSSRYVVCYDLPLADSKDIQLSRYNRELRIHCLLSTQWIALITDAGICFRKTAVSDQNGLRFMIQNELPLGILLGISEEKVLYYPLSAND